MLLLPIEQDIYCTGANVSSIFLATIHVLAFTYHPIYPHLLYILYGHGYNAGNALSPYSHYTIQTWDTNNQIVISNFTDVAVNCYIECNIKVSSILFLLESPVHVVLYKMMSDTYSISNTKFVNTKFSAQPSTDLYLRRHADIQKDYFVYCNTSAVFFEKYSASSPTAIIANYYIITTPIVVYQVLVTESTAFLSTGNGSTYEILCLDCMFNNTYANGISFYNSMYNQLAPLFVATSSYKMVPCDPIFKQGSQTIYWYLVDGSAHKIISGSTYENFYTAVSYPKMTSSSRKILFYGTNDTMMQKSFTINTTTHYLQFNHTDVIQNAVFSLDAQRIAIHTDYDSTNVKQYQLISNCSLYKAVENGSYCQCLSYSRGYCDFALQMSTDGFVFPMYAIIIASVIGAALLILVSRIVYVKLIKGWGKPVRTPWKYNPVELMSFQY